LIEGAPFIIVQTKADIRDDFEMIEQLAQQGSTPVSLQEAIDLGKEVGAFRVLECSALTGQGFDAVYDTAIEARNQHQEAMRTQRASQNQQPPHKKKCIIS